MKSAIITGATGFIGGWLVRELLDKSVDVTVLVSGSGRRLPMDIINKVKVIKYNPNNIELVEQYIDQDYDVFYNLGWGGVAPEQKNGIELQLKNVITSVGAVNLSKKIGCKLFIGIGTVAEYAYSDKLISGYQEPAPADIYGAAKVSAHYMCQVFAQEIGQKFIWSILSSTFGEGRIDNNIITYTIRTLLNRQKPSFTRLEQMWDYLYVRDTAKALYLIGEKGIAGKTYGVGSGEHRLLHEYINIVRNCIDSDLPLGIGEISYKNNIIPSSCVDNHELVKDTGFKPQFSFEEGIKKTIQYFKEFV